MHGTDVDNTFAFPVQSYHPIVLHNKCVTLSKIPSAPIVLRWVGFQDCFCQTCSNVHLLFWAGFQVEAAFVPYNQEPNHRWQCKLLGQNMLNLVLALKSMATFTDWNGFEPRVQGEKWFACLKLYKYAVASRRRYGPQIRMKCRQAWLSVVWCHRNLDLAAACFVLYIAFGSWNDVNSEQGKM